MSEKTKQRRFSINSHLKDTELDELVGTWSGFQETYLSSKTESRVTAYRQKGGREGQDMKQKAG